MLVTLLGDRVPSVVDVPFPEAVLMHHLLLERGELVHQLAAEVVAVSKDIDLLLGHCWIFFVLIDQLFKLVEAVLDYNIVIQYLVIMQQLVLHEVPAYHSNVTESSYDILRNVVVWKWRHLLFHDALPVGMRQVDGVVHCPDALILVEGDALEVVAVVLTHFLLLGREDVFAVEKVLRVDVEVVQERAVLHQI